MTVEQQANQFLAQHGCDLDGRPLAEHNVDQDIFEESLRPEGTLFSKVRDLIQARPQLLATN